MSTLLKSLYSQSISTLDDLIQILTRNNRATKAVAFVWDEVTDDLHRQLLYKIAHELKLPNPRLIASKHLEQHKFQFLNNAPLNGLYSYYKNRFPRKSGSHVIINVCDKLGIPEVSIDDWLEYIKENNIFSWKNIPDPVKKAILLKASEELGYSHPLFLKNDDFAVKFRFLNGKSLTGFYNYFNSLSHGVRGSVLKNMCNMLDIPIREEDWIAYIVSQKNNVFWDVIPREVISRILFKAASSMGYPNPRMMSTDDIKTGLDFLGGMSLYSFVSRFFGTDRKGSKSIEYICDLYSVPQLTFEEWVFFITNTKSYKWELLPPKYLKNILLLKAFEAKKENPRMLKYEDFTVPCAFLSNKNLTSLYNYYSHVKKDDSTDTINHMCNIAQIPLLTREQWITLISETDSKISWETVPDEVKKEILMQAAEEIGLNNPRLMGYNDFCNTRYRFLNGKTLSGLYSNYSAKVPDEETIIVQFLCDSLGIDRISLNDWLQMLMSSSMIRWESVPKRVQRELLIKATEELGLAHPRLLGTKELDSVEYSFLNGKTLSGLYYHYAAKMSDENMQINEFIFNALNIPRIEINPSTGRLSTIDSASHRKYFDSLANFKAFVNSYLEQFDLRSLCHKYTMLHNAKKAGIYIKGLITILAPLSKKEYIDFLYEIIKNTPKDVLGLRKSRRGDYRLKKADLYAIAGIDEEPEEKNRIQFSNIEKVDIKDKAAVIKKLEAFKEVLTIKAKKFHEIPCEFLTTFGESAIFYIGVPLYPGEIVSTNTGIDLEVIECRERKSNDGYVLEVQPLSSIAADQISHSITFIKDSNDSILASYMEKTIQDIQNDQVAPLLSVTLGLMKEEQLDQKKIRQLPDELFFNKGLLTNIAQKQAVNLALSLDEQNNPLAIIQGPPGTGKTTLIKEIALQYYSTGKNVLILAKTNVAVDNILEKLVGDKIRVLRTGNNIERKSSFPHAFTVSTSNAAYLSMLQGQNCITLGTPLGFFLDRNRDERDYDLLIIDEASQMDIPETLFALGFARKCIMIGDHMQIPPFPIQNEVLLEYDPKIDLSTREELQKSLFETLITDKNRYNTIFLDINYRTENPEMVSFISDLIYDGQLCPNQEAMYYKVPKQKRKKLFPNQAIEVIDTSEITDEHARMETEVDSTYYNLSEAMLSVRKVLELLKEGEKLKDICIITPYKAHAEKVKEVFFNHAKYFNRQQDMLVYFIEHNIFTIDSFQGREQDNVIINWVRSNFDLPGMPTRTGFLKDFRRVNVALSRAKKRLILIGDFDTLTRSENMTVQYIFNKIKNFNKEKKIVL